MHDLQCRRVDFSRVSLQTFVYNLSPFTKNRYGNNTALGSCRTEHVSAHLISVRLNERKGDANDTTNGIPSSKKIAYLIDLQTVKIDDLDTGLTLATINHDDSRIDWLEVFFPLNYSEWCR